MAKPKSVEELPDRGRRLAIRAILLVAVPVFALAGAGYIYLSGGRYAGTDDAYTKADTVALSADVPGRVVAIEVQDNQHVKAGQILFRLDDETYRIALAKAEAQLAQTRDSIQSLQSNYRQKQAELKSAEAELAYWSGEMDRQQKLMGQGFTPKSTMDQTRRSFDVAKLAVAAEERAIDALVAQLDGDPEMPIEQHAGYRQAVAQRDQAALDLRHTVIAAPADGIVGQVPNLQVGNYLTAGSQAFTLVESGRIWVEANMKETDLTYVRPGQSVSVTIDAYPDRSWKGKVASLSPASGNELSVLPAENATGNWVKVVQRIPVRIELDPGVRNPPLSTGMSAVVEIDTGHRRNLPLIGHAQADSAEDGQ